MGDKSPPAGSIDKLIEAVNHPRARRVVTYVSVRGGVSNRASAALLRCARILSMGDRSHI